MVAIHNKNGQGLLHSSRYHGGTSVTYVAIHNKNGQGLLHKDTNKSEKNKINSRNPQ